MTDGFLAFVMPIDARDLQVGRDSYAAADVMSFLLAVAGCAESKGYRTYADALRRSSVAEAPMEGWLFPDLAVLREHGFAADPSVTVGPDVLISSVDPPDEVEDVSLVRHLLSIHPEWGIPEEDAVQVNAVLYECQMEASTATTTDADVAVQGIQAEWLIALSEAELGSELAEAHEEFMVCLRGVDEVFAEAATVEEWFGLQFGAQINMLETPGADQEEGLNVLREWGVAYADCAEPLVEARGPLRASMRTEEVDRQLVRLLEMQAALDSQQ